MRELPAQVLAHAFKYAIRNLKDYKNIDCSTTKFNDITTGDYNRYFSDIKWNLIELFRLDSMRDLIKHPQFFSDKLLVRSGFTFTHKLIKSVKYNGKDISIVLYSGLEFTIRPEYAHHVLEDITQTIIDKYYLGEEDIYNIYEHKSRKLF